MSAELARAEAAIARGDYGQSLEILERLSNNTPLTTNEEANIRMLMITAWMGKGEDQKAINSVRLLTKCKDEDIRFQAKQLLSILEAPSLERPANWSINLPPISITSFKDSKPTSIQRKRSEKVKVNPPPTGPTKALNIGFSSFVLVILIGLTILLSGCVRITTIINVPGPDRVSIKWEIESSTTQLMPWQLEFLSKLKESSPELRQTNELISKQTITSPTLHAKEANLLLQKVARTAANSGGIEVANPEFLLQERNWFVAVQQKLNLLIDLTNLPEVPGLSLSVKIKSLPSQSGLKASPEIIKNENNDLVWILKAGEKNNLILQAWRWNLLGIGVLVVIAMLAFSLVLQNLRLQLGFGFPELPP